MRPLTNKDPRHIGPFRIVELLGSGGMGRVYLGVTADGRTVAVKTARRELADDEGFRKRFAREVAAARRVGGPFVAPVIDAAPHVDMPWMATEYVPGLPLSTIVDRYGPLPAPTVTLLAAGVLQALAAVHAQGLVHRDLKPSNIILTAAGPRVIDFGIARSAVDTTLTTIDSTPGTPGYMAPEQLSTAGPQLTGAADIFALGGVLAFAATGSGPFGSDQGQVLMYRTVYDEPSLNGLPEGLAAVAAACLDKAPDRRPTTTALTTHFGTPHYADWLPGALDTELRRLAVRLEDPASLSALPADHDWPAPGVFGPPDMSTVTGRPGDPPMGAPGAGVRGPAPSGPTPAAPTPQAPSRPSRRRVLASLSIAGVAAGGGTLGWALWPEAEKSPFPDGIRKLDAVMPVPEDRRKDPTKRPPRRYWLFSGDRFFLARASSGDQPLLETTKGPSSLRGWSRTLGKLRGFREGIDAALPVPDVPNEYWIFAGNRYIRIAVSDRAHGDTLKAGPRPIEDWSSAFAGLDVTDGIDGVMPTPDRPKEAWVFSEGLYVRTSLGEGIAEKQDKIARWSNTFGRHRGFKKRIDAAIPLPSDSNKYWVFSGSRYMKIRVADNEDHYSDERLTRPIPISPS